VEVINPFFNAVAYQDCINILIHLSIHTLTAVFQSHNFLKPLSPSLQYLSVDTNEQKGGKKTQKPPKTTPPPNLKS